MIFTRDTSSAKYRTTTTVQKIEILEKDMSKLKKKFKKDENVLAAILVVEKAIEQDKIVLAGECGYHVEEEIKAFIRKTRNNFAHIELSNKFYKAS